MELQKRPNVLAKCGGVHVREKGLQRDGDARGETRIVVDLFVSVAHAPEDAGRAGALTSESCRSALGASPCHYGPTLRRRNSGPKGQYAPGATRGRLRGMPTRARRRSSSKSPAEKREALRADAKPLRGIPTSTIAYAREVVKHTSYLVITKGPNGYIVIDKKRIGDAAAAGYKQVE